LYNSCQNNLIGQRTCPDFHYELLPTYDHERKFEALLHGFPVHLVGEIREADVAVELLGFGRRRGSRMMQQTGLLITILLGRDRGTCRLALVAILRGVVRDRRCHRRGRQPRLRVEPGQGPARIHRRRVRRREAAGCRGVCHRIVHLRHRGLRRRLRRRHRRHRRWRDYPRAVTLEKQLTLRLDLQKKE